MLDGEAMNFLSVLRSLLVASMFGATAHAASQVAITAYFADLPAGGEVPATIDKVSKLKGANVLNVPKITSVESSPQTVGIEEEVAVPGNKSTQLGVSLTVKATVTEHGNIWFSGSLRDRSRAGGQKTEQLETVGFSTREWHFSGYTNDGGTAVIRTVPATAQVVHDGKTASSSRELVAYLKFEKQAAPAPVKQTKPAVSKPDKTAPKSSKKSSKR